MRVLVILGPQYVSVCILNLPRHFIHCQCYVLGFWLEGRGTLHRRHGNTDQYQRVLESGSGKSHVPGALRAAHLEHAALGAEAGPARARRFPFL